MNSQYEFLTIIMDENAIFFTYGTNYVFGRGGFLLDISIKNSFLIFSIFFLFFFFEYIFLSRTNNMGPVTTDTHLLVKLYCLS